MLNELKPITPDELVKSTKTKMEIALDELVKQATEEKDKRIEELKKEIEGLKEKIDEKESDFRKFKADYQELCLLKDMGIDDLEKENKELKTQIEKMKCCENCKYHSYWGNELHCDYGLKEALQEDILIECKDMNKWELDK